MRNNKIVFLSSKLLSASIASLATQYPILDFNAQIILPAFKQILINIFIRLIKIN